MKNIDELLKQAAITAEQIREKNICGWGNVIDDLATALRAMQTENERLKGEYARGIKDAAQWHIKQGQYHLNSMNCGSENGEGKRVDAINAKHVGYAKAIRALLPKQKEGE